MFLTNSKNNRTEIDWLEPDLETFDKYDKLVVLCHGWWTINAWIAEAGNVLISNGICVVLVEFSIKMERNNITHQTEKLNFIEINWKAGANLDDYNQSVANTQIVGRQIAYMYNELRLQRVDFDRFVRFVSPSSF